jgi:hypothetical protein
MKKLMILVAFASLVGASTQAQSLYEAAKIENSELTGTARFVGMGGAMGALGGDISTMGVNPAGIGIYRSSDVAMTLSYANNSIANGTGKTNRFSFDNLGVVLAANISNHGTLRYVNFGFNYSRRNSFYKNVSVSNVLRGMSLAQQMALQANQSDVDYGATDVFNDNNAGWLAALGWNSGMLTWDNNQYAAISDYYPNREISSYFESEEKGGINQFNFNISTNLNDRVYLGMTVGTYDVNYHKYSLYDEAYSQAHESYNSTGFGLESWNSIRGTGFDLKFGLIVRPFESSPLRLGIAVHTPTFYNLSLNTSARIQSDLYWTEDGSEANIVPEGVYSSWRNISVDTYDELGGRDLTRDFRLQTPWVLNLSAGYTIGSSIALGAEYEYEDYSTMEFTYPEDGYEMVETGPMKSFLRGVSTWRLGAEWKVVPALALRVGYTETGTAFMADAYKSLPYNSITTDTDFANKGKETNLTFGIGYRGQRFYADAAFKLGKYSEQFYEFDNADLAPAQMDNCKRQLMLTVGMRF